MINNLKNKFFTLIELIVVIAIVIVLAAAAFLVLSQWITKSRDARRDSDLSKIQSALEIIKIDNTKYPEPDNITKVYYNGTEMWRQGEFGETAIKTSKKFSTYPKDPAYDNYYTYSITSDNKKYQISALQESDTASNENKVLALNTKAAINGTYDQAIITIITGGINYILAIPSIILSNISGDKYDLKNIQISYFVLNGKGNIPTNYKGKISSLINGPKFQAKVLFSGNSIDVLSDSNGQAFSGFAKKLKEVYSGNDLKDIEIIKQIQDSNASSTQGKAIIANIINKGTGIISSSNTSNSDNNATINCSNGTKLNSTNDGCISTNGLIGEYTMDSIEGTTLVDTSSNGNNGSIIGCTQEAGVVGNALNFNGSNNYVDVSGIINNPTDLTQSLRINTTDTSNGVILTKRHHDNGEDWPTIRMNPNKITINIDDSGYMDTIAGTSNINDGNWHHIVGVKNGNDYKIYVDGILEGSTSNMHSMGGSTSNLHIGHHGEWNSYYKGKIDQVRLYSRALSDDEITDLFREGGKYCATKANNPNFTFNKGSINGKNIPRQNTNANNPCYYTCKGGYYGSNCENQFTVTCGLNDDPCNNIIDDNTTTSRSTSHNGSDYAIIDLGENKLINYISMYSLHKTEYNGNLVSTSIYTSTNRTDWTKIIDGTNYQFHSQDTESDNSWHNSPTINTNTRYLKIETAHSYHRVHIVELKIY